MSFHLDLQHPFYPTYQNGPCYPPENLKPSLPLASLRVQVRLRVRVRLAPRNPSLGQLDATYDQLGQVLAVFSQISLLPWTEWSWAEGAHYGLRKQSFRVARPVSTSNRSAQHLGSQSLGCVRGLCPTG